MIVKSINKLFILNFFILGLYSLTACSSANNDALLKEQDAENNGNSSELKKGTIKVVFKGLSSTRGNILLQLVPEKKGTEFPPSSTADAEMAYILPKGKKENSVIFSDIPYGTYSIAMYDDNNRNGKLDMLMGFTLPESIVGFVPLPNWPTEGYGFSCADPGLFLRMRPGPPGFTDTHFELNSPERIVPIPMNYFWRRYGWTSAIFGIPVIMGQIASAIHDPESTNSCNNNKGE
jgi:uncharacterized protein (DUF2141 family)